jgi:glycosyltransferase involved in cell wall biosynthesis
VLIVRNEEAVLRDCLESVAEVADQLVVVDTGSEDGTVAIAEAFQAEIHHFTWVDDFSAARNEMLRHTTCDWIMYLDADEVLMEDSRDALRALLQPVDGPVLYSVNIRNLLEDQVSYSITRAHRLFTNGHNLRFSGKIHEQVFPSFKGPADGNRGCNVFFSHRGYAQGPEKLQLKRQRNIILLEQDAAENPASTYAHYMHGQGLVQLQRYAEAYDAFQKALGPGGLR